MITPILSRKVAHWLLTSDAPTETRLLIMEATSGPGATDEELLLALEASGYPVTASAEWEIVAARPTPWSTLDPVNDFPVEE